MKIDLSLWSLAEMEHLRRIGLISRIEINDELDRREVHDVTSERMALPHERGVS